MSRLPAEPKKIKQRIRRYQRELAKEQRAGGIHDGSGKRYLLGPLYLLLDDVDGALASYTWFQKTFPDDMGEPFQYLCWTYALYRSGDSQSATRKLAQTWFQNPYLIARLLGMGQPTLDMWHGSNWEQPAYVTEGAAELLDLWDDEALAWAKDVYQQAWFGQIRARYLEIKRRLKDEPVGPQRSRLVDEMFRLKTLEGIESR